MQVALTIPVSSAACERNYFSMRRLKNWLESIMLQQCINLSILNIKKELSNDIIPDEILNTFSNIGGKLCLTL